MIKTFKYFDNELKGQKIYEAFNDRKSEYTFTEKDVIVPELISDNPFLLKISKIVLKKLDAAGLGKFGVYPIIINIDNVPGVYFYNQEDSSMNIVICRNTNGKQVYLFKSFTLGGENVADLVLTTSTLGFKDIINALIKKLTPSTIEEGLICEWVEGNSYTYTEKDVARAAMMSPVVREAIFDVFLSGKKIPTYNAAYKEIWNGYESGEEPYVGICKEIETVVGGGKKLSATGYLKSVIMMFNLAARGESAHEEEINALFLDTKYKPKSEAISSETDVTVDVDDEESSATRSSTYEKMLEKNTEEYEDDLDEIYEIAVAMCQYVKKAGQISKDERSALESRGMLITGVGGIGKTESIKRALKDTGMIEDKDYYEMSSGSTAPKELFKKLYDYNGKLLIFDDTADLFNTEYKLSLWKNALQGTPERSKIVISKSDIGGKSSESNIYDPIGKTRQDRYFLEVGHASPKEEAAFRDAKMKKLEKEYREETGDTSAIIPKSKLIDHQKIVDELWAEHEEERTPKMPSQFNYKGVVVIISNKDIDTFVADVGGESQWSAIESRFSCFDLHPMPEAIWSVIKKKILAQRDIPESELPDDMCMIPRDIVDEFISEVESYLAQPKYRKMNFRLVAESMHNNFQGSVGRARWKKRLRRLMNKERYTTKK